MALTTVQSGVIAGGTPAFRAYAGSATSLSGSGYTKVLFNSIATTGFDTNSNYNTSTSRFTPTVAGYYQITGSVRADIVANSVLSINIYKNGSAYAEGQFTGAASSQAHGLVTDLIFMNGSTDYVEIYAFTGTAGSTSTGSVFTYFSGCLVRGA